VSDQRPLTPEEIERGFDYDSVDTEYHPIDCECRRCLTLQEGEPEMFDAHGIDCTCIYCIPGA
jgi:hypothetical protein